MNSVDSKNLLHGVKISSVVPSKVTGETAIHELSNLDLAMKLHYLRTVYYYKKEGIEGLDIYALKASMFKWLDVYSAVAGRIRRSDSGRPFIKCNDSGVRIIEAQCNMALDEWLEMKDQSLHKHLVPNNVLGPELFFSPLVFLQFTKFKCGGLALGFSWAHVLGGPFTASKCINTWGQHLSGDSLPQAIHLQRSNTKKATKIAQTAGKPLSARPVQLVGDHWITANNCKMELHSFHITNTQLNHLRSEISDQTAPFEAISALIWHCLAKIRGGGPKIVTVCRRNYRDKRISASNDQIISTVEANFSAAEAELSELAALIVERMKDENKEIETMVDDDDGLPDLIVYGANLTFLNLEEIDEYGFELKGQKPVSVYCDIDGIGDEGVVLVLWEPSKGGGGDRGWKVTVVLPENEIWQLRDALERDWCIT